MESRQYAKNHARKEKRPKQSFRVKRWKGDEGRRYIKREFLRQNGLIVRGLSRSWRPIYVAENAAGLHLRSRAKVQFALPFSSRAARRNAKLFHYQTGLSLLWPSSVQRERENRGIREGETERQIDALLCFIVRHIETRKNNTIEMHTW